MKRTLVLTLMILLVVSVSAGQRVKTSRKNAKSGRTGNSAVVVDQRLSVLRKEPSLYSLPVKRLKTGARVTVFEEKTGEGVSFYRVADTTAFAGWIQSEAISGTFRKNEDQRLFNLILGSTGFVRVQRSVIFLDLFDESPFRPTVLLLLGDVVEEEAAEITGRAKASLVRREMAAARAPLHSFYLNYSELDPYRSLGIRFLFNANTRMLHYSGDAWFEITRKFPESPLTIEARERIGSLSDKMKAIE